MQNSTFAPKLTNSVIFFFGSKIYLANLRQVPAFSILILNWSTYSLGSVNCARGCGNKNNECFENIHMVHVIDILYTNGMALGCERRKL